MLELLIFHYSGLHYLKAIGASTHPMEARPAGDFALAVIACKLSSIGFASAEGARTYNFSLSIIAYASPISASYYIIGIGPVLTDCKNTEI